MDFVVFDLQGEATIEFPRIYYLGYELLDEFGERVPLYKNSVGLLAADISHEGTYHLYYKGTWLDRVTRVISGVVFVILVGWFCFWKKRG